MAGPGAYFVTYFANFKNAMTYGVNASMNIAPSGPSLDPPRFIAYTLYQNGGTYTVGTVNAGYTRNLGISSGTPITSWRAINGNTGKVIQQTFVNGDNLPDNTAGSPTDVGYYLYPEYTNNRG